jgi:hypothetical protein
MLSALDPSKTHQRALIGGTVGNWANLRQQPSTQSRSIYQIPKNSEIEIRQTVIAQDINGDSNWFEVRYTADKVYRGWLHNSVLDPFLGSQPAKGSTKINGYQSDTSAGALREYERLQKEHATSAGALREYESSNPISQDKKAPRWALPLVLFGFVIFILSGD